MTRRSLYRKANVHSHDLPMWPDRSCVRRGRFHMQRVRRAAASRLVGFVRSAQIGAVPPGTYDSLAPDHHQRIPSWRLTLSGWW
jgi:hypothetical protein